MKKFGISMALAVSFGLAFQSSKVWAQPCVLITKSKTVQIEPSACIEWQPPSCVLVQGSVSNWDAVYFEAVTGLNRITNVSASPITATIERLKNPDEGSCPPGMRCK